MKISFCCQDRYWGGLGPNGGSRTILLSAKTLCELGHEANVVTNSDKYTWHKHPKPLKKIPKNTDACIACSVSDIKPMLKHKPKGAKAFWYCRLIESHQMPKDKIVKRAAKIKTIVNSEGLQRWFRQRGIDTTVAYQGVDVDLWQNHNMRKTKTIVGFLISKKPRKHFDVVKKIVKTCGERYDYIGYGASQDQDSTTKGFVGRNFVYFKTNPSHSELVRLYNICHTWVATSTSEGLHNPPIEAALCGCAVVFPNALLSGCVDHCIDGKTAYEYDALDAESASKALERAGGRLITAHQELIKTKIGSRKQCMQRFMEVLND